MAVHVIYHFPRQITLFSISGLQLVLFAEYRVQMQKFPILDRFCKIHCSSLNTELIHIILDVFEHHEHSQNNPHFKILFFGLGMTYKVYFRG